MPQKKKKKIPKFKNEASERAFWASADSSEYIDWKKGKRVTLGNLKPSTKTISLRLPEALLDELRLLANKRDVPYASSQAAGTVPQAIPAPDGGVTRNSPCSDIKHAPVQDGGL